MSDIFFSYGDVQKIVSEEVLCKETWDPEWVDPAIESTGVNPLKERVTERVRWAMQITSGNLPPKARTWIHRICMAHTAWLELEKFTWKLAIPIELRSLSNSKHHIKTR